MAQYEFKIRVNGITTVVRETANDSSQARRLIEAKYAGQRVNILSSRRL